MANFLSKIKGWTHMTHPASTLSYISDPRELFFRSTASTASRVADFLGFSLLRCVHFASGASQEPTPDSAHVAQEQRARCPNPNQEPKQ